MKAWVKGDQIVASKVDPTLGTILAALVEILVRFDLHTKLGLSPEDLLRTMLDIAFITLMVRSVQIHARKGNRSPGPPMDEAP